MSAGHETSYNAAEKHSGNLGQDQRKRMKFSKWGQTLLATTLSAGIGLGLTSCGTSNTIDYLFLASANPTTNAAGGINAYEVDSITGALTQVTGSPFPAGTNPISLVPSPNGQFLYVVNHDDSTVYQYNIATGAQLSLKNKYTTPGTDPVAVTVNPAGTLLFVVETYAPGFSATTPGAPGALVVYPIGSDGTLGNPATQGTSAASYYLLGSAPTAVNVLPNGSSVYVTDQLTANAAGCQAGQGGLVALTVASGGALTPVTGSPYCAGVTPSSVTSHPIGNFLYVTDSSQNQIVGYHVQNDGTLLPFVGGPIATGTSPVSITIEARGLYMYVSNHFGGSIGSYQIAAGTGIPSSTGSTGTEAFPQCVIVDPALARFVYVADFAGIGVDAYRLDPNTGMLTGAQNEPYPGSGHATCVAAVAHGNHATIHVQGTAGS